MTRGYALFAVLCYHHPMKRPGLNEVLDLLVVGAGPAALVALHAAKQAGLRAVALDKGPVCSALLQHPTYMRWFSTADKLELAGFPLLVNEKNPTRREYLQYCRAFVTYFDLSVAQYHEVTAIIPLDGLFRIEARDLYARTFAWRAENVLLATGFYDSPRPIAIKGGDLPKVTHRYSEAHYYWDTDVAIIGAGSSAAETALELWRTGARVTVVMRGDRFHTKYWIEPDIENRIAEGSIACLRNAKISEIGHDTVRIRRADGSEVEIPNDFVLAMTGYEPDTTLLESLGAQVDPVTRKPVLNDHFETTLPGLYAAGALCAGCESNTIFIENSRDHGPRVVAHILARRRERAAALS